MITYSQQICLSRSQLIRFHRVCSAWFSVDEVIRSGWRDPGHSKKDLFSLAHCLPVWNAGFGCLTQGHYEILFPVQLLPPTSLSPQDSKTRWLTGYSNLQKSWSRKGKALRVNQVKLWVTWDGYPVTQWCQKHLALNWKLHKSVSERWKNHSSIL